MNIRLACVAGILAALAACGGTSPQQETADAGDDQEITSGYLRLGGQARPQGTWSLADGPGPVAFDDPSQPSTSARFAIAGRYRLRLRAGDALDEVVITVKAATWSISGSVLDDGNGAVGQPVALRWTRATADIAATLTDAGGRFAFSGMVAPVEEVDVLVRPVR